ncbi:P-loop containing nucleoside triphosphate hydrolase [Vigna unguiculata]|uniref:P-loop containing nucleoside triphosphate hydrolase n=1 Tax=Vigna unguiculata TaxID=3917 RepID=A0A4D6N472_VIGUN|nr:P-loop containing nucleoside triphosphate hydrolase [Vigna unguiculata]
MKLSDVLIVSAGLIAAAAAFSYLQSGGKEREKKVVPKKKSGKTEGFSHYVARQLGFQDAEEVPHLCSLVQDYLKRSEECDGRIYEYISHSNGENIDSLYIKLVDEIEKCILSYFSFNWNQAPSIINQALSVKSPPIRKLREIILAATRKIRFERVIMSLRVTRVFSTLVEEMKALQYNQEMVPANLPERSPVLLFLGGGMGAGKSTIREAILKEAFWSQIATNAVIVEADAFKEKDDIYKALNSTTVQLGRDHNEGLESAETVHEFSTRAASSLLVTALNEGRDVIMDSTLSWEPFVKQTITMARNVHRCKYRMGEGYKENEDGTVIENYWVEDEHGETPPTGESNTRQPYRIELVGVVCDSYIAIVRGIRRAIATGRAVRVNAQLKSHQRFARAFPKYCELVDNARLYFTNAIDHPPKLIGWKDGVEDLLVHPRDFKCMERIANLNVKADCIYNLYKEPNTVMESGSIWSEIILAPSRIEDQKELRKAIEKSEKYDG